MDREIELKLEGDPEALDRLIRTRSFASLKKGKSNSKTLRSVYFDTQDFALMDRGFALRVRANGRDRVQTFKSPRTDGGPASDRGEWENPLQCDSETPDVNRLPSEIRARIAKLAGKDALTARFVSTIHRRAALLQTDDGGEIELAIDRGAIEADGRAMPVSELELELKRGTPADLYRVALQLADLAPLRVGMRSKAERGLALARGETPAAIRAVNVQLDRQASIEEAFAAVLRQCLAHLLANQAAAFEANLPEGLHQMRVALRRLRSAFLVFGRVIDGEREEDLMREAKWLTRAIGRARDYDVFTGDVIAPVMAKKPGDKGLQSLARAAAAERAVVWAEARRLLAAPRTTRFVLQLALYLDTQGWRARRSKAQLAAMRVPVRKFAEAALDRRLKSVTKLARDIGELEVSDRHELRKRLKKLRYTMSFLATLYPADTVRSYLRRLSDLQNVFGALNDLEVAREIINELGRKQPRLVPVGESVLAWHQARARREWRLAEKFWVDFRDEPLFWRS